MQMKIERIKKKTTQQIKPNYGIEVFRPRNNTTEISPTPFSIGIKYRDSPQKWTVIAGSRPALSMQDASINTTASVSMTISENRLAISQLCSQHSYVGVQIGPKAIAASFWLSGVSNRGHECEQEFLVT
jgi:hypothetical protein